MSFKAFFCFDDWELRKLDQSRQLMLENLYLIWKVILGLEGDF